MATTPDISYWLGRKYAIAQQQADAGTTNAAATTRNAATSALVGAASAGLDNTRAGLLPGQTAAENAQTLANANILGLQAQTILPESTARIANINSTIAGQDVQTKIATKEGLTTRTILPASLQAVMGANYPGFRLEDDITTRPTLDPAAAIRRGY